MGKKSHRMGRDGTLWTKGKNNNSISAAKYSKMPRDMIFSWAWCVLGARRTSVWVGDRLTSRLAMCANAGDKRPLHMHTLANGKCVSAVYTHPERHTDTHKHTHTNWQAHQMPFAWIHMQICMSQWVFVCTWNAQALRRTWSAISMKADFNNSGKRHSPVISTPPTPSHFSPRRMWATGEERERERLTRFETEWGREGQIEKRRRRRRESQGEEREVEDRQGKHVACHCVQKSRVAKLMVIGSSMGWRKPTVAFWKWRG